MQKTAPVFIHVTGWLVFFSMIFIFLGRGGNLLNSVFSVAFAVFFLVYMILFYGNVYLLENFYSRIYRVWYIIIVGLAFLVVYLLEPFDHLIRLFPDAAPPPPQFDRFPGGRPGGNEQGPPIDIISIVLFITTWSLSTAYVFMKHLRESKEKAALAEVDKTKAELSFLKAQVNPHFLFNTLNNIYTLTLSKDEKAPEAVRKLSEIMRYITDEAGNDFVPLNKEIEYSQDYIDLQRLRLNGKTQVKFTISGNTTEKLVAPLIFMTFIDNAFKYGISGHENSLIDINIHADEEMISFFCSNRILHKKLEEPGEGLGIANASKRLKHMYPRSHRLEIKQEAGNYIVDLKLYNF